jgi:peptide/nickel transport system permease protein
MKSTVLYAGSVAARAVATLLAVSVLVFMALHFVPGGFERLYLGSTGNEAAYAALRKMAGLDRPLLEQYLSWVAGIAHGDFGNSLLSSRPIAEQFSVRIPATVELALLASVISIPIGTALGIGAGIANIRGGRGGGFGRLAGALSASIPDFVLAAVLVFGASLVGWKIAGSSYIAIGDDPVGSVVHMLLPASSLSFFATGIVARTVRDAVLAVRAEPFMTMAIARGESIWQIIRRHILRNIANPLLTVSAVNVGYLLGGAVIIERIFAIPGVGDYAVNAVNTRDYPVVMATVMLGAMAFVFANAFADVAGGIIDPRIGARRRTSR